MSRPFSYHDEHFDVIGNVLFVRYESVYALHPGVGFLDIPPEIEKRLISHDNCFIVSSLTNNGYVVPITVNDHSFIVRNDVPSTTDTHRLFYAWYPLKDI